MSKPEDWIAALPGEKISHKTLESLPEYSCSVPTLAKPDKVWKRDLNFGIDETPLWVICEYVDHPTKPNMLTVQYRRPILL